MPKGIYKRTDKHLKILVRRNKSIANRRKVSVALMGHGFAPETIQKLKNNHADFNGAKNPRWKGGFFIDHYGYKMVYRPDHPQKNKKGYVREHRLVVEKMFGPIPKGAVVHHIDGDRLNNTISNLQLLKNDAAHGRIHQGKGVEGDVLFDGRKSEWV